MEHKRPPNLLRSGQPDAESSVGDDSGLRSPFPVNETAELVADLIAATALLPADKLALVRGRAGQSGSIAQALVDEGIASGEGIALMLGMLAALLPSVVLLARHGSAARKMGIPFAPFLALGTVVGLFAGHELLDAYLKLLH